VPGIGYSQTTNGVPEMAASAETGLTSAEQLRMALPDAGRRRHTTVIADMTRTRSCDCGGLDALAAARRQAMAEGGELRLVLPAHGAAARIVTTAGLDRLIPGFASQGQALALVPADPIPPSHPRPSSWPRRDGRRPGHRAEGA
jgi:anti-anti-sigma factor